MAYDPQQHTTTNKSYGIAQAAPTDARSYYSDGLIYRPYQSTTEVLQYLNRPEYRQGNFPVYVQNGAAVDEYTFRDGTADINLVKSVTLAVFGNTYFTK